MMNWKGFGRTFLWLNLRYYPSICLEGLRKPQTISVRITSLQAEMIPEPPEYEAGVLTT
jgi:hypothetical protein